MAKPAGTIFVELTLDDKVYKERLSGQLTSTQATAKGIETSWKVLGAKNDATYDAMRRSYENALTLIKNSTDKTKQDIIRAEEAAAAKIKALNDKQFGAQIGAIDKIKKNWIAASVAVTAAIVAINRAIAYAGEGAKAMQIESAFKIMADSAGVNSERLIESMKAATRETIDDSAMMQKAVKLMTLEYNPEQIERFSRVVITASQIAGTTAAEAYDELADAIANRMPKALVRMGAATREQMQIVNAAIEAGADSVAIYELAMANLELKQKMLQGTQNSALITMERLHARIGETTEAIGKGLIIAIDYAYRGFEYLAAGVMGLVSAYARYRELVYQVMGDEKQAADNRFVANVALETRTDLLKRAGQGILDNAEAEKRASKEEIAASKEKVSAQMESLKAITDSKKKSEENSRKAEAEAKKSAEVNKTFWEDYKRDVEGALEFEKFKLDEQYKAFDKYVHDKVALESWYQAEKRKIEIKEYAETAATQFPSEVYGAESARAKAYTANEKAKRDYAKSVEDQLAANAAADKKLNEENWWKTYIEDTEDATRANEIFKDSMNIMSQSAADAFAEFATGTKSAKDAFTEMAQSMIASMVRMQTQKGFEALFSMILSGSGGLLGSLFGGGSTPTGMGTNTFVGGNRGGVGGGWGGGYSAAKGAIFDSYGVQAFARGGVVDRPTFFPMAKGTGLMGEAGPEAVMPLKRLPGGNLGVESTGQGGSSLTINVPVTADTKSNRMASDLRTEIEDTVERVVRRYS